MIMNDENVIFSKGEELVCVSIISAFFWSDWGKLVPQCDINANLKRYGYTNLLTSEYNPQPIRFITLQNIFMPFSTSGPIMINPVP
jgi:hypothetical protein